VSLIINDTELHWKFKRDKKNTSVPSSVSSRALLFCNYFFSISKGLYSTSIKWKARHSNLVKEKGEIIITGRSNAALWIIKSTPASENRDSASCTLLFRASSPDDKSKGNTSTPAAGYLPLHKPIGQLQNV
jgi:hypothetical protein